MLNKIDLVKLFRGIHLLRWHAESSLGELGGAVHMMPPEDEEAYRLALGVLGLLDEALDVRDIPPTLRKPDDATMALALFAEEILAATVTLSTEPAVIESFRRFVRDAKERAAERAHLKEHP